MMLFLSACLLTWAPPALNPISAFQLTQFHGQYDWIREEGVKHDIKATLNPQGKDSWDIKIWFVLEGKTYTYEGHLKGVMGGPLDGSVENERKSESYRIALTFVDGHYEGHHYFVDGGEERENGQLWLFPGET